MKIKFIYYLLLIIFTVPSQAILAQERTVGFYNVENLFDIIDDEKINDEEFLPDGRNEWNAEKYANKLEKISSVFAAMNLDIAGVSEVENRKVLEDLVTHPNLKSSRYQIIHFNSTDYRGIDVALIYKPSVFRPFSTAMLPIKDPSEPNFRTRDILLVKGLLDSDTLTVFVSHWPSRRGGKEDKRLLAAQVLRNAVDSLLTLNSKANIICVGDFNDDPTDKSLKKVLNAVGKIDKLEGNALYNTSAATYKKGYGTGVYNGAWNLFDQVIISGNLAETSGDGFHYIPKSFTIFAPKWMQVNSGADSGSPLRNFSYGAYQNGYSDHYPVYIKIK